MILVKLVEDNYIPITRIALYGIRSYDDEKTNTERWAIVYTTYNECEYESEQDFDTKKDAEAFLTHLVREQ